MTGFLQNKKAIVTGGSRGIGLEIARSLLQQGADVLITGRKKESLAEAAIELAPAAHSAKLLTFSADVANDREVAALFAHADQYLGGLDILVNNAGVGIFRTVGDLTLDEWKTLIATNLSGTFYCSHSAIERFRKRGSGFILNISSLAGRNAFAGGAAYNASKFGMNGFSEAMMLDHRNDNIRVSYIMPGSVDTGFDGSDSGKPKSEWKIAPEDVAAIVLDILRMPERTLISRVEVRPSRPRSH